MKRVIIETTVEVKRYIRYECETEVVKRTEILEYADGGRVCIPVNPDGSVKWFDDSKLLRH